MTASRMLRWAAVIGLGMLAGCAQILGIDELSGDGQVDAGAPPGDPDAGSPPSECARGGVECAPGADCIDDSGMPVCECRLGLVGDGYTRCVEPWEPVTTIPDRDFYTGFGAFAVGLGTRLYFFPEDNSSAFFASYDTLTGAVQEETMPPVDANDFCACGLGQVLVALDDYLYQFGNYGLRYLFATRSWEQLPYDPSVARGEAAGAAIGRRIVLFGGRDNLRSVQAFDIDGLVWTALGNTIPFDLLEGAAVAVEPNQIYVFGGTVDGQTRNQAAVYDVEKGSWTLLPDMPESIGRPAGAGIAFGKPYVLSGSTLYHFDPGDQTWKQLVLPAADFWYAANVGADVYIVGDVNNEVVIQRLVTLGE